MKPVDLLDPNERASEGAFKSASVVCIDAHRGLGLN